MPSGRSYVVSVEQDKMEEHFTRQAKLLPKNILARTGKNTTRRMTSSIGRIFAELNVPFYHVLRLRGRIGDGNLMSIEESMFPLVLNYEIL